MNAAQKKARLARLRLSAKKGGDATKAKVKKDPDYYKKLGKKGGLASWKLEE